MSKDDFSTPGSGLSWQMGQQRKEQEGVAGPGWEAGQESAAVPERAPPYEVPEFPIERLESQLQTVRKTSMAGEPGLSSAFACPEFPETDQSYQKVRPSTDHIHGSQGKDVCLQVNISGSDITGVTAEDMQEAGGLLQRAIQMRQRYMQHSRQSFSQDCSNFLQQQRSPATQLPARLSHLSLLEHPVHAPPSRGDHWDCAFPPDLGYNCAVQQGVFTVSKPDQEQLHFSYPRLEAFVRDMQVRKHFPGCSAHHFCRRCALLSETGRSSRFATSG